MCIRNFSYRVEWTDMYKLQLMQIKKRGFEALDTFAIAEAAQNLKKILHGNVFFPSETLSDPEMLDTSVCLGLGTSAGFAGLLDCARSITPSVVPSEPSDSEHKDLIESVEFWPVCPRSHSRMLLEEATTF
ncbi:hypothetical protein RJT34_24970 [Clitoria ternatea]|uniref:Uncharacterized protein n=1 Tax=Clitoria ternatea TaxID=43366 RepID=A0AAN9IJN2_CLITE